MCDELKQPKTFKEFLEFNKQRISKNDERYKLLAESDKKILEQLLQIEARINKLETNHIKHIEDRIGILEKKLNGE